MHKTLKNNSYLEFLIDKIKNGQTEYFPKLIIELNSIISYYSNKYFAFGESKEDIEMVCQLAIWEVITKYQIDNKFNVRQCINRNMSGRVFDFVTKSSILKSRHLNESVTFNNNDIDFSIDYFEDVDSYFNYDNPQYMLQVLKPFLNSIELQIMELKLLEDLNYNEIAMRFNCKTKKIDNIVAKVMLKLKSPEVKEKIKEGLKEEGYYL